MTKHSIMGGKVHVYKRGNSTVWQCSSYMAGRNHRVSTKEKSLALAKEFAEDWYLTLREKKRSGQLISEKTFSQAADQFLREFETITQGQRSNRCLEGHEIRLRLHLKPFFGKLGLSEITPAKAQEYRIHRAETSRTGKPPARSTMHDEICTLRMVLKTAINQGWLKHLPDLSVPYRTQGKIIHRPWFSPKEYKQLYTATRKRALNPEFAHIGKHAKDLHDMILFVANTGLRPDELYRLEHRDVEIVEDVSTRETILEIEVRGKRGVGYCKSTLGAVRPYQRIVERNDPVPTDRLFPNNHRKMFNTVLTKLGLKFDRDGQARTLYSLRHTYICMRLMEGADIYQVAKNCRTSVEMIEKHYAAHIKNMIDTSLVNVRRTKQIKVAEIV